MPESKTIYCDIIIVVVLLLLLSSYLFNKATIQFLAGGEQWVVGDGGCGTDGVGGRENNNRVKHKGSLLILGCVEVVDKL